MLDCTEDNIRPETGDLEPDPSIVRVLGFWLQGVGGECVDRYIVMGISITLSKSRAGHMEHYRLENSFRTGLD